MQGHVRPRHSARRGKREAVRLVDVVWWSTKELPDQAKGFSFALRTRGNTESSKQRADRSDSGLARPRQAYRYNTYKQSMNRSETRYQNYKETEFADPLFRGSPQQPSQETHLKLCPRRPEQHLAAKRI